MSGKLGRNDACHCGSGKKYKKCHMREDQERAKSLPPGVSLESLEGSVPLPSPDSAPVDSAELEAAAGKLQGVEQVADQISEIGNPEAFKQLQAKMAALQALMQVEPPSSDE